MSSDAIVSNSSGFVSSDLISHDLLSNYIHKINPSNVLISPSDVGEIVLPYINAYNVNRDLPPYHENTEKTDAEGDGIMIDELNGVMLVNNIELYRTAFTHNSYTIDKNHRHYLSHIVYPNPDPDRDIVRYRTEDYEALEFLGDKVFNHIMAVYIQKRFPQGDEEFYTVVLRKLVNSRQMAKYAAAMNISRWILLANDAERDRENQKVNEDIFEAFIGAFYKDHIDLTDSGEGCTNTDAYDLCTRFAIGLVESEVDWAELLMYNDNHKTELLKYYQSNFGGKQPVINILERGRDTHNSGTNRAGGKDGGKDHGRGGKKNRQFLLAVIFFDGSEIGRGTAPQKRDAEEEACRTALERLKNDAVHYKEIYTRHISTH